MHAPTFPQMCYRGHPPAILGARLEDLLACCWGGHSPGPARSTAPVESRTVPSSTAVCSGLLERGALTGRGKQGSLPILYNREWTHRYRWRPITGCSSLWRRMPASRLGWATFQTAARLARTAGRAGERDRHGAARPRSAPRAAVRPKSAPEGVQGGAGSMN